ncbi:MAG: hypothetical protein KatS3mg113_0479 [Planctomycetaceae bacterium]|nr:MAG: hypothetical protein KatS3mg113_0479 [Planctomycetaceae bacterium]
MEPHSLPPDIISPRALPHLLNLKSGLLDPRIGGLTASSTRAFIMSERAMLLKKN